MTQIDKIYAKLNDIPLPPEEPVALEEVKSKEVEAKPKGATEQLTTMIVSRMEYATDEQKHRASQIIMHLMAKVSGNPQVFGMFMDKANIAQTARIVTQIVNLDLPFAAQDMYYIIPYKNALSLQLSYYGMMEIAYRAGVYNVQTNIVYEGDDFDYYFSNTNYFKHKPTYSSENPTHYYSTCKVVVPGSKEHAELLLVVMTELQMQKFKQKYSRSNPLWNSEYLAMAKKTVVKQLLKLCPKDRIKVELNEESEEGSI